MNTSRYGVTFGFQSGSLGAKRNLSSLTTGTWDFPMSYWMFEITQVLMHVKLPKYSCTSQSIIVFFMGTNMEYKYGEHPIRHHWKVVKKTDVFQWSLIVYFHYVSYISPQQDLQMNASLDSRSTSAADPVSARAHTYTHILTQALPSP